MSISPSPLHLFQHRIYNMDRMGKKSSVAPTVPNFFDPRQFFKKVDVSFMNRIFQGIGFHNNNGGLEFFCDAYKERRNKVSIDYLQYLRGELTRLSSEFNKVGKEVTRGQESLLSWQEEIKSLDNQLRQNNESLMNLVVQGRNGKLSSEEKCRRRQQIKGDGKHIKIRIEFLKKEVSDYYNNYSRSLMLQYLLPEIRHKISNLERELSINVTYTIERPGLILFRQRKDATTKNVNLFFDILDYIAYLFLLDKEESLSYCCDNIIMNDPRNFTDMFFSMTDYEHIYCYFPRTVFGETLDKTITESFSPCRVTSQSNFYAGHVTLYEYASTFDNFIPITNKI